jgi:hypothetical protein
MVQMAPKDQMVTRVQKESKDRTDLLETPDLMVQLDLMDFLVHLVHRVTQEHKEAKGLKAMMVLKASKALMARKDHREFRDTKEGVLQRMMIYMILDIVAVATMRMLMAGMLT